LQPKNKISSLSQTVERGLNGINFRFNFKVKEEQVFFTNFHQEITSFKFKKTVSLQRRKKFCKYVLETYLIKQSLERGSKKVSMKIGGSGEGGLNSDIENNK
jgi:hypothetical protein